MNTNRRRIAIAAVLGLAALTFCAEPLPSQDAKPGDSKQSDVKQDNVKQEGAKQDGGDQENANRENKDGEKKPTYGLIFGTAYGPDDRPIYGVRVKIYRAGKKHPSWELFSDHRGEFAQRVPPGPADFVVIGDVEVAPMVNGKPQMSKKKRLKGEAKVHLDNTELRDFGLHLNE